MHCLQGETPAPEVNERGNQIALRIRSRAGFSLREGQKLGLHHLYQSWTWSWKECQKGCGGPAAPIADLLQIPHWQVGWSGHTSSQSICSGRVKQLLFRKAGRPVAVRQ